ncbi:MAG TPA: MFS transporter [Candidatus Limnocylindrales bacterium]|nr:MFS transporter [Candidatus Limnocylindrales bacterium]
MRSDTTGQRLLIWGGLLAFLMIGWTGLLMPALIRDIQRDLVIDDGQMGLAYGIFTGSFLVGCLFTGWAVSRTGRRPLLLTGLAALIAGALAVLVPSWEVFLGSAALRGFGSGVIEVGVQGLFLAAFTGARQGRAINSVHLMYSIGATIAPVATAVLLGLGLAWSGTMALTAVPLAVAFVLLALAPIPGRPARTAGPAVRLHVTMPLVALAVAIALYVAAEVGVTSWLVRFLEEADLGLAAAALTLFWVALAVSRLLTARFGHRVAPETVTVAGFVGAAIALTAAVLAPSVELAIVCFTAAGFCVGPVYAGIILVGGRVSRTHKDAVTSVLASAGVSGSVVYPPLMGAISLGAGLGIAMGGAAVLCLVGAVLVVLAARRLAPAEIPHTPVAEPA